MSRHPASAPTPTTVLVSHRLKQILWAIERKLAEDAVRPIILYDRFATCWQPYVKGPTIMVDSLFNSNRREDWWLDK